MSADEVARLQNGNDPECKLAQKVFEQGHYAGRTRPTNTRQGTYATAPSGVMLASINSNDPKAMADMLRRALAKWNSLSQTERMLGADPGKQKGDVRRGEAQFPTDGLVLRVFSRDLPRTRSGQDWRNDAWNQDYAWFTRSETKSMLPAQIQAKQTIQIPEALVKRLAKFNFVDNVRGQTMAYTDQDVTLASLTTEVVKVSGGVATIRLYGETKAENQGSWSVAGYRDMDSPESRKRGMNLKLYGRAQFNIADSKFTQFEAVALGDRFGGTQYNGRHDDLESAPIGYALVLAGAKASERVAPSFFYAYRWPR
ncbi:MAG: hypothetical protein H7Y17_17600 [Chlorobia bacterium]|nr:hypothetical protein [Fimbriimonadaceae bacterium]